MCLKHVIGKEINFLSSCWGYVSYRRSFCLGPTVVGTTSTFAGTNCTAIGSLPDLRKFNGALIKTEPGLKHCDGEYEFLS